MSTPSQILALVDKLKDVADLADRPAALRFSAEFSGPENLRSWQSFMICPGDCVAEVVIRVQDTDAVLGPDDQFTIGRRYSFTLRKTSAEGEIRLFYQSALREWLSSAATCTRIRLADLKVGQAFRTRSIAVEPWTEGGAAPLEPIGTQIDPSSQVFDLSAPRIVPNDLRPWLIWNAPTEHSRAFTAWREEAALRLWASLVDQVAGRSQDRRYRLSGPPVQELDCTDTEVAEAFRPIHEAAKWVYVDTNDKDARHLLLAIELAHTIRISRAAISDALPLALENAKAAYRAHVQSANRETLKALGELRRAAIDETQKTVQRTQELTGALWRDLLVASAPFVIKIVPDANRTSSEAISRIFMAFAAIYLIGSFTALTIVNRDYFREQARSRKAWKDSVGRYLPRGELTEISDAPVDAAAKVYDRVHLGIGIFYLMLVVCLIVVALLP